MNICVTLASLPFRPVPIQGHESPHTSPVDNVSTIDHLGFLSGDTQKVPKKNVHQNKKKLLTKGVYPEFMAGQPTPPKRTPPSNKALLRAY